LDAQAIFERVIAAFGDDVFGFEAASPREVKDGPRDAFFKVKPARLVEVLQVLRNDPALRFDFLQNLTAVDWLKAGAFSIVYHLHSYPNRHEIVVKVEVPRDNPRVPSIAKLWKNANWLEREQFDLLGVVFEGHPDLRRLMMPDDWIGHPMRKDYREPAAYRDMPTSRPSALDLLLQHDKAGKS
jgi:NADH-quinone oxidoreductase subunit C